PPPRSPLFPYTTLFRSPGFLNSTAALATAYSTGAKVLALIGQIPSRAIDKGRGLLHEIPNQIGILRTLTKWADRMTNPQAGPALDRKSTRLNSSHVAIS